MNALNKKIASFYKLLANQNRFLNKEAQHLHFSSLWIMPLDYDPVLSMVKLSWLVGQVQYLVGRDGHLLWYQAVPNKRNCFKICFEDKAWIQSADSLTPVNMQPTKENIFRLVTKPLDIHKSIFSN